MIFVCVVALAVCAAMVVDHLITATVIDAVTESVIASLQSISIGKEDSNEAASQD